MAIDISTVEMTEDRISDNALYEVVDGQIVELPPMGTKQELTASDLLGNLWSFTTSQNLGRTVMETLFDFTDQLGKKLRPDVAFVSFDRWPKSKVKPQTDGWKVVPNLAVEVISPTNAWEAVQEKIKEYFQVGVERVWIVSPAQLQVHIYASPKDVRVLTDNDDLTDDKLFPGFRLALRELFS